MQAGDLLLEWTDNAGQQQITVGLWYEKVREL